MKRKHLMAVVRGKDGKLIRVPIKESRDTYKVTDSIRERIGGNTGKRDLARDYYLQRRKR